MKYLVLIIILTCLIVNGFARNIQSNNNYSLIEKKIDTLRNSIKIIEEKLSYPNRQTTIKIDSLQLIIESLKKDSKETWIPAVIAFLAVSLSSYIAYLIAVKQLQKQSEIGDTERDTQISIAQDQLQVSREQIAETTKMNLTQIKANNISQARIKWIQELRDLLSLYISELAFVNYEIDKFSEVKKNSGYDVSELESTEKRIADKLRVVREVESKILLFLNSSDSDHKKLENLIAKYMRAAINYKNESNENELNDISNKIILISKKILKDTWEQAKDENNI